MFFLIKKVKLKLGSPFFYKVSYLYKMTQSKQVKPLIFANFLSCNHGRLKIKTIKTKLQFDENYC